MPSFAEQNARERILEVILDTLEDAEDTGLMSTEALAEQLTGQVWDTLKELDPADLGMEVDEE